MLSWDLLIFVFQITFPKKKKNPEEPSECQTVFYLDYARHFVKADTCNLRKLI